VIGTETGIGVGTGLRAGTGVTKAVNCLPLQLSVTQRHIYVHKSYGGMAASIS
jgi:hypothetical protein